MHKQSNRGSSAVLSTTTQIKVINKDWILLDLSAYARVEHSSSSVSNKKTGDDEGGEKADLVANMA